MTSALSLPVCQLISYEVMKTPSSAINRVYDVQKSSIIIGVAYVAMGCYDVTAAIKNSVREIEILKAKAIKLDSNLNLIIKIKEVSSFRLWNGILELGYGSGFLLFGLMNMGALNWNDGLMNISQNFCRSIIPISNRDCSYNCLSNFNPQDGIIPTVPDIVSLTVPGPLLVCDGFVKTMFGSMGTVDCIREKDPEQEAGAEFRKRRWSPKLILIQGAMSILTAGAVFTYTFSHKLSMATVYGKEPNPQYSDSWDVCQTLCAALNMTSSP